MILHNMRLNRTYTRFLFILLFACFAAAIIGDSAAEALLLAHFDAAILPRLFLINALVLFAISTVFMFLIDRFDRSLLFMVVAAGHSVVLLVVRAAVAFEAEVLFPVLFTYAYVMKIILFLLFWTLANDCIDSRRAQKKFPLIAAGGTLGAITVAFAIPGLVRLFATEDLLFVWSGCTVAVAALMVAFRKKKPGVRKLPFDSARRKRVSLRTMAADYSVLRTDPLLANIAALYAVLFFILIAQQYFFYAEVKSQFQTARKIAEFLGMFSGISMTAAMVLQVGAAGRIVRWFGSARSMVFLPIALALVFAAQGLTSVFSTRIAGLFFLAIVLGMGLRIAFFDSLFSPNFQVFFSSLPRTVRGRAKLALDGIVKPAAILCAGFWLMIGTGNLPLPAHLFILAGMAVVLLVISLRLKAKYRESLTRFLAGAPFGRGKSLFFDSGGDMEFMEQVRTILNRGRPDLQNFLIEQLAVSPIPEFISLLKEHAPHADARVRAGIVTALGDVSPGEHRDFIIQCLDDTDGRVVANAVMETGFFDAPAVTEKLRSLLGHESARVRANATIMLWRQGMLKDLREVFAFLEKMLYGPAEGDRASALFALGEITEEESTRLVCEFARQNAPSSRILNEPVFRQLVKALGKKDSNITLDVILGLAQDAHRWQNSEIISALGIMLEQERTIDPFLVRIRQKNPVGRNVLIRAMCEASPGLSREHGNVVRGVVREEVGEVEFDRRALDLLRLVRHIQGIELLRCAIREESFERRLETAVNAITLFDPQGSIRKVMTGLFNADPHIRARAIEVLDSAGDVRLNRLVISILENKEYFGHPAMGGGFTSSLRKELLQTIGRYRNTTNAWVNRCAENAEKEIVSIADSGLRPSASLRAGSAE
jgi:HEAT repeat protein/ATP/ADP translocase